MKLTTRFWAITTTVWICLAIYFAAAGDAGAAWVTGLVAVILTLVVGELGRGE